MMLPTFLSLLMTEFAEDTIDYHSRVWDELSMEFGEETGWAYCFKYI